MMKDETASTEITEFAGLGAKCYALVVERGNDELRKLNIDVNSFSNHKEQPYTRPMHESGGIITNITRMVNNIFRSFMWDGRRVSKEIKKDECEEGRNCKGSHA